MREATASAHANIAIAKYWGKADEAANLPAVPSVSMTLAALTTTTTVRFDASLGEDELILDGNVVQGKALHRVTALLDRVRARAGSSERAHVLTSNDFPTASGLASSASAFAALALAATAAAGLQVVAGEVSDLARRSSASAARSVLGGFVRLASAERGADFLAAEQVAPAGHWDVRVVIGVNAEGAKSVGSTDGMLHTQRTSPYYAAWVSLCPGLAKAVEEAIASRDIEALGEAAEHSALAMHASAMAAAPGVVYFNAATMACLQTVRELRRDGVPAYATMDAGPHVKVITLPEHVGVVDERMRATAGLVRTIVSKLGGPAVVRVSSAGP